MGVSSAGERLKRFERALAAWGHGAQLGELLGGGNRNLVRVVRLGGSKYAARLSHREPAALAWECQLLARLSAADMRVARSIPALDGRQIVDGLMLFEWMDGDPPESAADWRLVAEALRGLHRLTAGWPQRPGFRTAWELCQRQAGGDVRLNRMPPDAVRLCRAAWSPLGAEPESVIHGDPGVGNLRIAGDAVGLIDWDESRVDASVLDLAGLPIDLAADIGDRRAAAARRAVDAWEAAAGWTLEPAYARRRLARLCGSGESRALHG